MFIENRKYAILRVILVGILIAGIFGVQPARAGFLDLGWAQGDGGTNFDYGTAIAVDDNGNVYATGFVTNGPGNQDVFINEWDTDGNFLWSKSIAGSSNESSHAVTLDGDGNVYVAGYYSDTVEFDPGNASANRTSAGITDAFVIKYDSNGQFIWVRSVGGSSADSGTAVALDSAGNVYLIGYYNGTADFDPGAGTSNLTSAGSMDVFVSKFDNNGTFIWAKSMGGTSEDETYDIAIDGSGNIFVTGYFSGTADFDPGLGTSNLTSVGGYDLFISKLDSNGNFVWAKSMGSPSADNGIEIALDESGNIYMAGYFMDAVDTGAGILVSAGFYDILISKLDNSGNVIWAKGVGGTEYDAAYGIVLDGEGNVCITGEFSGTVDFDPGASTSHLTSAGASDIFISKLGSNGNFIWAKHLGGTSQDVGDGIAVDASNNVYLTGYYSDTANFDPGTGNILMTSTGSADIFISKLILWPQVYYVNHNASGANNGSSPADAYTDLQSALAVASSGDQIWVAAGTYKPTTSTDRNISFRLKKGVAIYGGFDETFWNRTNITVLSGDIGVSVNNSDNSYHVVVGNNTNSSTILDGFIITGGNANLAPLDMGGGMLNQNGSPTLTNVAFSRNTAVRSGGGMVNDDHSSPTLTNVTFDSNTASAGGGMMNWSNSSPTLINVTFHANSATDQGGGIYNDNGSKPNLQNVTIKGNTASQGGGIYNAYGSDPTIINSILYSDSGGEIYDVSGTRIVNYSIVQGGYPGTSNLDTDPLLGPLQNNGGFVQTMALLSGSTAIDAGDDSNCPATDQRGFSRPQGSHCDIGSFEYFAWVPATPCPTIPATGTSTPTPTATQTPTFTPTGTATPSQTPTSSATPTPTVTSVKEDDQDTTGVFRPANGALYLKNSNTTGFADVQIKYGVPGDYPVVGDWDGNGTVTIGIDRNGSFYLRNENTIGYANIVFPFGMPGDQPIAGDWDGDGVDTIGVYRPSTGQFLLRNSNSAGVADMSFYLGNVGDVGIAGDWDGDGLDTTGVFRPTNGIIFLKNTNTTGFADIALNYGIPGDKPVTGDWNGDGVDTIGVYRNGRFYLRNSNTVGFADLVFDLGIPGDVPIAGNWDGQP